MCYCKSMVFCLKKIHRKGTKAQSLFFSLRLSTSAVKIKVTPAPLAWLGSLRQFEKPHRW